MNNRLYSTLVENPAFFRIGIATVIIITISIIGFREVHNLSVEGRIFTMGIFIFGIRYMHKIDAFRSELCKDDRSLAERAEQI